MAGDTKYGVYEFDEFRLDAAKLMLYREGREIVLPPKAVKTLLVLIEHGGGIVSKDELMNRIWGDMAVEESNLSQYLYLLRKTLGKRADGEPLIETLRRRGYRFNGAVQFVETSPEADGGAPPAAAPESHLAGTHHDFERYGNVLKVVEWTEPDKNRPEPVPNEKPEPVGSFRLKPLVVAVFAAVVALAAVWAAFSYVRRSDPTTVETPASARSEMTFVRLTNGAAPLDATISPNGDYFVYHEQDGATAHLWLQQTGQSNRIEISPPIEKILRGKTFSPDGKFIYFIAQDAPEMPGVLYRVPTLGGTPVRILENVETPVSFSPDGKKMVFRRRPQPAGEFFLSITDPAGNGERKLPVQIPERKKPGIPAWSPDGLSIALCAYDDANQATLYALDPETGAIRTLSPEKWDTCYRMFWTHDGAGLVFIGTKAGEGYSTRRDQVYFLSAATGEARRLTTDGNRHQILSLGITAADEILVVPFNRSSQIWQMNPSGEAQTAVQITSGLADGRAGLAAMADGRIAYVARIGENLSVWTAGADGADQKQLTFDPPFLEEVQASPDGRFLVFSAHIDGYNQLFQIDPDGANLRQLTFGQTHSIDSAVSPDGNWIVHTSQTFEGSLLKTTLQKIPSSGGTPVLLADYDCMAPNYSPDGKFISCVYNQSKFVIISAEDGTILKTFEPVQVAYFNTGARWTPDGRALVYIARRKNFSNLWRQPIDGGPPEQLTDFTNGELHNFTFAPDGSRLYIARGFEIRDVMLIKNFR